MTDRPMIFSAQMVRALADGRKTMTRRWPKPQPICDSRGRLASLKVPCVVGDRIWVRETWQEFFADEIPSTHQRGPRGRFGSPLDSSKGRFSYVAYRADGEISHPTFGSARWRSPIHMPRLASRFTLTVREVDIEGLHDIREADAEAEGVEPILVPPDGGSAPHVEGFRKLWNELHGPGAWDANPWVAAIRFTVERRNIDAGPVTEPAETPP